MMNASEDKQQTSGQASSCVVDGGNKDHCYKVSINLNELRKTNKFCDVILVAGKKRFPAHKAVLCTAGGYFSAVFDHDLKERHAQEIELPTICPSIMDVVLEYIYTGQMTLGDLQTSQNVLIAADYLSLTRLRKTAIDHMKAFLTTSNFLQTLNFADRFNFAELSAIVCSYVQCNFTAILKAKQHLRLGVEQLVKILKSDDLKVEKEEDVFDALVEWINYGPRERASNISTLFAHTRLCEIPHDIVIDKILREKLVISDPDCYNRTLEYLKDVMIMKGFCGDKVVSTRRPRQSVEAVMVLSGTNQPMCYLPSTNCWYHMPHMQWEHKNTPISLCDGQLYVTSGRSSNGLVGQTEVYDPKTNQWTSTGSLPASNYWPGLVSLHGLLYLVGGRTPTSRLKTVWRYDPKINQWDMVSSLMEERSGPAVVSCLGHIYAIGGRKTPNEDLSSCERYDPLTNMWQPIASMKTGRSLAAATNIAHRIFVIGGSEDSGMYQLAIQTNEVYDSLLNEWSLIARCCSDRVAPGICSFGKKIYIFGGRNQQESLITVEVYNSKENEWQVVGNCDRLLNTFSISCCIFYLPTQHLKTFTKLTSNAAQNLEC